MHQPVLRPPPWARRKPDLRPMGRSEPIKSRDHPKYKARCRVANRRECDNGPLRRGDVTVWLSPDALKASKAEYRACERVRAKTMEDGVWIPLTRPGRECLLPVQGDDRRTSSRPHVRHPRRGGHGRLQRVGSRVQPRLADVREGCSMSLGGVGHLRRCLDLMQQRRV